jgi:uncharacterized protein YndB with AHSA1/START domain
MSDVSEIVAPVVKVVSVSLPVEAAFQLFTEQIHQWWPLASHSVFGEEAAACRLEGRVGGRFYEIHRDGREADWGQVLAWEPPHRLVVTMHPGRAPDLATQVEVTFTPEADGTRLTLTHSGWERFGASAVEMRGRYDSGWELVLNGYAGRAGA